MVRWILLFLLLFNAPSLILASDVNTDTLKATLTELSLDNEARIGPLLELAYFYLYIAPEKTAKYATQALAFSSIHNNNVSKAKALRLLGQAEMYQGLNQEAFAHLNQAINSAKASENSHLISVSNRVMGVFHELIIDHDNAMKYYIIALTFAKLSDKKEDLAMVFNNLGNVLNSQHDYNNAARYFEQSITINAELNDLNMEMNATVGLSVSLLRSGDVLKAQNLLEKVISNQSLINDFIFSEASVNLAHVYKSLKAFSSAKSLYRFVIDDEKGSAYPPAVAAAYLGLADVLIQTNHIKQAGDVYRKGIIAVKGKISVKSEMTLYENLAKLELNQGNFETAATIQSEYIERRNQIKPLIQDGMVEKLENQLQIERDYIKLQNELIVSQQESQHSSWYLFTAIVISLVSLALFLLLLLRKQVVARLTATNKTLKKASETDPLTGIGNRRYLDNKLEAFKGQDIQMAFILLDIDHFKEINDNFGHDAGDEILIAISETIKDVCRKNDIFARMGGEEFVILSMSSTEESACFFAERVRACIEGMSRSFESTITTSIGIALGNMKEANYDDLYKQSDIALYLAKSQGRNRVILSPKVASANN
ncbi:MAG: diguanylate cyclase (GGDEF)-like protein [Colwellia sp.]|jgi:diguanylate cyclase (GGDEF)-like protein